MFSNRTAWNREPAPLAEAVERRRAAGLPLLDLTASNPTRCGFALDEAALALLAGAGSLQYEPLPFGKLSARDAVAGYYRDHGIAVPPQQVCLTASTSEAYSFLFRLLCNPGDEVLIASPSYPLFEYLASLNDVRLVSYPLVYDHAWHTVPALVEEQVTPRTRAIVLVHPNNPTGHFVCPQEREGLEAICERHGLALIVDEVFLDYAWGAGAGSSFAQGPHRALTFVLSGLSKIAGLPQMKLGWAATFGPEPLRDEALARLEVIADTFLSVSAPVQIAAPTWLAARRVLHGQIGERLRENLRTLDAAIAGTSISRLHAEAGWYAVLRLPAVEGDEGLALRLVAEHGVSLHPGSAFGFGPAGWLVVSLLPVPELFGEGVATLAGLFSER